MDPCRLRPDRVDGYVPIESYAALGDGRTVALVARDGRIDWWPLPTLDAPPGFAAIVDPEHGGYVELTPAEGDYEVTRRYLPHTNVLETTFHTASGEVRVTDALAVGHNGRLPWSELIRQVEGVSGSVRMVWDVRPGTRFDTARCWVEQVRGFLMLHLADQHLAVRPYDVGEPQVHQHNVCGEFSSAPGSRHLLAITSSDNAPVFVSHREAMEGRLQLTIDRWRSWSQTVGYEGRWADAVQRSAVALKLLLYAPTGAIAAAATTSLPERIGGDKNWDYRYMWVRDASFTADALLSLHMEEEVQAAVNWLLDTIRRSAPNLHVFYKLDGSTPDEEHVLAARGYRGSRPVRAGNSALAQRQLGTYGHLFDTVWKFVDDGHLLDPGTGRMLADLADRCCDVWLTEDASIWELHRNRHYTISKIGCWVALDRAVRLAELSEIPDLHADRWAHERDDIKRWVERNCWSEELGSYTFYAGSDGLDAATLLGAHTGFDRGERMSRTIDAVRDRLARGPLVYRYTGADKDEGAFLACTFWLVTALAGVGRRDEAAELMDQAVQLCNDVGLLAEEMDPSGAMLGNFPQGLSHLALINAAVALADQSEHRG